MSLYLSLRCVRWLPMTTSTSPPALLTVNLDGNMYGTTPKICTGPRLKAAVKNPTLIKTSPAALYIPLVGFPLN